MASKERVLVTGAAGFLGRHLVRRLVDDGCRTIALGRTLSDQDDGQLRCVAASTQDAALLGKLLVEEEVTGVVHLSAQPDGPLASSAELIESNLAGTARLLQAASEMSTPPHVVLASSIKVYGRAEQMPLTEATPLAPTSAYAVAKVAADQLGLLYHEQLGLPVTVLRLTQIYGPGQPSGMLVQQFLEAAARGEALRMTKGEQTRDLLYVDDVVDAFRLALTQPSAVGAVLNLGSGVEVSIADLVKTIGRLAGAPEPLLGVLPYREGEMWRLFVDPSRARELLGFEARFGIEEGLKRTVEAHVRSATGGGSDGT